MQKFKIFTKFTKRQIYKKTRRRPPPNLNPTLSLMLTMRTRWKGAQHHKNDTRTNETRQNQKDSTMAQNASISKHN